MRLKLWILAAVAFTGVMQTPPVKAASGKAETPPPVYLVIDSASGMADSIHGLRADRMVRQAVDQFLLGWPKPRALGLIAAGHRFPGRCGDAAKLSTAKAFAANSVRQDLKGIQPRGERALIAGLKIAAEQGGKADPVHVILVAGGGEACEPDPCAAAEKLKRARPKLVVQVVSIGLQAGVEQSRLACIAETTGGEFQEALDTKDLVIALVKARERVLAPAPD